MGSPAEPTAPAFPVGSAVVRPPLGRQRTRQRSPAPSPARAPCGHRVGISPAGGGGAGERTRFLRASEQAGTQGS